MLRRQLRVVNREGIHARPAALIVELANRFDSEVWLIKGAQRVDAKSIMELMTLAAEQGSVLVLEARGPEAQAAADALEKIFSEGLGDVDADPSTSHP